MSGEDTAPEELGMAAGDGMSSTGSPPRDAGDGPSLDLDALRREAETDNARDAYYSVMEAVCLPELATRTSQAVQVSSILRTGVSRLSRSAIPF